MLSILLLLLLLPSVFSFRLSKRKGFRSGGVGNSTPKGGYTTGGSNSGYRAGNPPASGPQYYGVTSCSVNCGSYFRPGYYNAGNYYGGYFPGGYFAGGYFLGSATASGNRYANRTQEYRSASSHLKLEPLILVGVAISLL